MGSFVSSYTLKMAMGWLLKGNKESLGGGASVTVSWSLEGSRPNSRWLTSFRMRFAHAPMALAVAAQHVHPFPRTHSEVLVSNTGHGNACAL